MCTNIVHVTVHGQKYHKDNCVYLPRKDEDFNKKTVSMPLAQAEREAYKPCQFCIGKTEQTMKNTM